MRMVQVPYGRATITRIAPDLGPEHYKSYSMRAPLATHWRPATCEEYECDEFLNGFVLHVDLGTELGQRQFHYVTKVDRSRSPVMERENEFLVHFRYGPGTQCFEPKRSTHRVPIGRPALFVVAEGDWRGNPRNIPVRVHRRVDDWVDDFATHQDTLAAVQQRG